MMKLLLALLILCLTACGGGQAVAPIGSYGSKAKASQSKAKAPSVYKVKKGDTGASVRVAPLSVSVA